MSWPLSQDYNEAIQDPRSSFADAELKSGEAVTNALGIPLPRSGNFADVYQVHCPSGSRWAVKCFTREVHGLRERYAEISKYLHQINLPFTVDFHYLEQGIRIAGRWYPVLKMHWVEGFTLNEFVRDNLDKPVLLEGLSRIWLKMAQRLRESHLGHCDLQHGNVLLVPGSSAASLAVKLIDYDGMWVPALAKTPSGEVGHPAYQHPQRLRDGVYSPEVDRFPLLVIATALRGLSVGGRALWERHDNGDNLLFRQQDFEAPGRSPLFAELLRMNQPEIRDLVVKVIDAARMPLEQVPHLTDLLPEEKPASKATKMAASRAVARQPAGTRGPDWDFGDGESGASVVTKRHSAGKMPRWVWGAIGGTAAVLLLGVGLALRNGPAEKTETAVARNKPEVKGPKPTPKAPPPIEDHVVPANEADNPPPAPPADRVPDPIKTPPKPPAERPSDPVKPPPKPVPAPTPEIVSLMPSRIFCLTPAGDALVHSNGRETVWRLVDPRARKTIREFKGHDGTVTTGAFTPDGLRAVTGGRDQKLRVWDVPSGRLLETSNRLGNPPLSVAISPDGRRVASTGGGRQANVWDLESRKSAGISLPADIFCVAFSPDGRQCFYGPTLWDIDTSRQVRGFRAGEGPITCIAMSPDRKYVAAGQSGATPSVWLWKAESGERIRQHTMPSGPIHQVAFSSDSRILIAASGHSVRLWQVEGGQDIAQFDPDAQDLACGGISSDGKAMLCASCKDNSWRLDWRTLPANLVVKPP